MDSKVALVTASSAGVGAAIARALACDAGMRVAINYRSRSGKADALIRELENSASAKRDHVVAKDRKRFIAVQGDMGSKDDIQSLVKEVRSNMGRLDVVVSNAGWTQMRDFMNLDDNVDEDDWNRCFNVNLKAHLWLFQAVRPYLDESKGAFISTASVAGVKPSGSSIVRHTAPLMPWLNCD